MNLRSKKSQSDFFLILDELKNCHVEGICPGFDENTLHLTKGLLIQVK